MKISLEGAHSTWCAHLHGLLLGHQLCLLFLLPLHHFSFLLLLKSNEFWALVELVMFDRFLNLFLFNAFTIENFIEGLLLG